MLKIFSLFSFAFFFYVLHAQKLDSMALQKKSRFSHQSLVYFEPYVALQSGSNTSSSFLYNHNEMEGLRTNLALVNQSVSSKKITFECGIMAGDYVNQNLKNEPGLLKYLYQLNANISLKNNFKHSLTLGVFPSHIGFEGIIGKQQMMLSRSVMADNSPYFETGIKYTRQLNSAENNYFSILILNGWQTIKPVNGLEQLGYGTELKKAGKTWMLGWNTYWGTASIKTSALKRGYSNFYFQKSLNQNQKFILGFDCGTLSKSGLPLEDNKNWYVAQVAYTNQLSTHWILGTRVEWINDQNRVILTGSSDQSEPAASLFSGSIMLEKSLNMGQCVRVELRNFYSAMPHFPWDEKHTLRCYAAWCLLLQ